MRHRPITILRLIPFGRILSALCKGALAHYIKGMGAKTAHQTTAETHEINLRKTMRPALHCVCGTERLKAEPVYGFLIDGEHHSRIWLAR